MFEHTYNLTHRIFCETLERLTKYDDHTAERCYVSSNEYLSEYMGEMDLTNKKLATVGSSGDQFFNALLQGSKDITIIDANPYTKLFVEYKIALIENLKFDTFSCLVANSSMFHSSVYAKISHSLSRESKLFWDTLMLEQVDAPNDYIDEFDQNKLARQLVHRESVFFSDFYKDEATYSKLQKLLREKQYKLQFFTADLHDFPKILPEKYDLIMLSNIFCYHENGELRYKFEKTVEELYNNKLNPGGSIQVQYNYRHHWNSVDPNEMAGKELRIIKLDKDHNPRTVYFLDKPEENELNI